MHPKRNPTETASKSTSVKGVVLGWLMLISHDMEFLLCKGYKLDFTTWQRAKSLVELEKRLSTIKGNILQHTRVYNVHASYYFHVQAALSSTNNQLSFWPSTSTLRVRPVGRWVDQHLWLVNLPPPPPNVHPPKNSRPYDQSLWKPLVLFPRGVR